MCDGDSYIKYPKTSENINIQVLGDSQSSPEFRKEEHFRAECNSKFGAYPPTKHILLASWFLSSQALVIINYKDFQYALVW